MNGAARCVGPNTCRRCCRRSSPLMPERALRPSARALARPSVCCLHPAPGWHDHRRPSRAPLNLGHQTIPVDRRGIVTANPAARHRRRFAAAAEIGKKEHDRLVLARTLFERKLWKDADIIETAGTGRARHAKPLVSAGMVAKNARCNTAGGAADRFGAGPARDDGQGEVRAWGYCSTLHR